MHNDVIEYHKSDDIFLDSVQIIESAHYNAYRQVDSILVLRNWLLGKRIAEENMDGERIERYGARIISDLAQRLTKQFGKGFDKRSLYRYVKFYKLYSKIVVSVNPQSVNKPASKKIVGSLTPQSFSNSYEIVHCSNLLSWTHYTKAAIMI